MRPASPRLLRAALQLGLCLCVVIAGACRAPLARQTRVPLEAEAAFEQALDRAFLIRSGALDADEHAALLLETAARLAPDWWAVERARQDELRRSDGALAAYTQALAQYAADESDARAAYLLARLEGAGGAPWFERSRALAPANFWPWHGLAQLALGRADSDEAQRFERLALERARSGYERVLAYETILQCADPLREPASVEELCAAAERELADALPEQRARWRARRASVFLAHPDRTRRERAWAEARDLLLGEELSARDQLGLFVQSLRQFDLDEGRLVQLRAIHARWPASLRNSVEFPDGEGAANPTERAAAFARLEPSRALAAYLDALPVRVREACLDGQLALDRARGFEAASEPEARDEAARQLSLALLRLGWHAESLAFARALADAAERAGAPTRAVSAQKLLHRAQSALALERDVLDAFDAHAAGRPSTPAPRADSESDPGDAAPIAGALERLDRATRAWWPGLLVDVSAPRLRESPLLDFSPLGQLVHPGPWYGEPDERAGRDTEGGEVEGLARLAAALGRFALLGRALTVGSDGCWMTKVAARREAGEQFGTRWSGTTVFCDGARFPIGPARAGAEIAGLAVHDGYWIDLAALRAWAARIDVGRATAEAEGARAFRAPSRGAVRASRRGLAGTATARARAPWLGEAGRVRRACGGAQLATFEQLLEAVSCHEAAHLCDRIRLWPPWRHPGALLRFLARAGFTPRGVISRLEYRAELSALCLVEDPRFVLAALLEQAEQFDELELGVTQHARAYDDLAHALVAEFERTLERGEWRPLDVDPALELQWQLHRLQPEELRMLARQVAAREGL